MCCKEEGLTPALVEGTDSYYFDFEKQRFYTERDRLSGGSISEDSLPNSEEAVNHPKHYNSDPSGIECIEVTRHRNFCIGNAIKYLWRAGLKDEPGNANKHVEDLKKAIWYINDEIGRLGKLDS